MQNKINSFQLFCILFISRLLGTFTYMVRSNTDLHAGGRIVMTVFYLLFSLLFSLPVFLFLNGQNNTSVLCTVPHLSCSLRRALAWAYATIFLLSAIITVTRFGLFAGTVLLQNTSLYVFIFSLILVSVYCACKGIQPMARTAVLFAFILFISLLCIQVGVLGEFQLINIPPVRSNHFSDIIKQAFFSACRNIEIPAVLFIADSVKGKINNSILRFLTAFSVITAFLFTVAGGVTGEYGEQQMFPLFTLSSLAKAGMFERTEDLLTGIWVMCAVIKIAFLLYACGQCLQNALQKDTKNKHIVAAGVVVFGGYLILSANVTQTVSLLQSWVLPIGFMIFGVLIPAFLYMSAAKNEKRLQKEHKA